MLLFNVDIRDGALTADLLQRSLNIGTIICEYVSYILIKTAKLKLTNLIKLNSEELGSTFIQKCFGSFTMRAPRLAEDSYQYASLAGIPKSNESGR